MFTDTRLPDFRFRHSDDLEPKYILPTPSTGSTSAVLETCQDEGLRLIDQLGRPPHSMVFVRPYRVDVVVPIYGAPDYVARCIASLEQHSCPDPRLSARIVLINDASRDRQVDDLLARIAHPNWLVLQNQTNQGFVETVNRGILLDGTADVVLLNSDTQVTAGWLLRLAEAAYSAKDIATATALSNTASIYSWPLDTPVAARSAEQLAEFVAAYSPKLRPTIPTGVGSCLYIKRSVLDTIGLLDPAYGWGYEEENDFCMRATEAGYRHILADDVFVWHKGQASMRTLGYVRKSREAQKNENLLLARYPSYRPAVREFLDSGVMDQLRQQLTTGAMRRLAGERKHLLFVLHNPFGQGFIGGTEFHVEELVRRLSREAVCYVLYPQGNAYVVEAFSNALTCRYTLPPNMSDALIEGILRGFGVDLVHIQHLRGMPSALPRIAQAMGIPVLLSVHDHYAMCPNYALINEQGRYCGLPADPTVHQRCLAATLGKPRFSLVEWRTQFTEILKYVDLTLFFSDDTRTRFQQVFSLPRTQLVPYGIRLPNKRGNQQLGQERATEFTRPSHVFRVCFLGYTEATKGKYLIQAIVPRLVRAGVEVHFLGSLPQDWPLWWRYRFRKQVIFHGRYKVAEVVDQLQDLAPQLVGILSAAPETFSRTLSEAWAARIPVLVGPIGAQAERVRQTGGGVVLPRFDSEALIATVLELKHDRHAYQDLVRKTQNISVCSEDEMVHAYRGLYANVLQDRPSRAVQDDFITILNAYQTPPRLIDGEIPVSPIGPSAHAILQRPEQLRLLMPKTVFGQAFGILGMVYIRIRSVGWRKTLGRPLRKLRWRFTRHFLLS